MPPEVERRLAAILSADVVGYSRLMAADEQATVRMITAYRTEISNLVSDHRGRVVDATGDNALAEFPTALDAVEAAVEIQKVLRVRNESQPDDRRMEFRIGIHLGDVTVEGERIYGDGVNIAARLQGMAEPGGICISGAVYEQVDSKLELRSDDLGEQTVKNIPKPVRVFRVRGVAPSTTSVAGAGANDRSSIVVLPFADMSPEKDQEYFCDGMAEEVINALAQLEGLHVVARTSAFSFKGRDIDVRKIGGELGVQSVLEGSVRKAGDRLRVTAQLINVADGYHLWSERFNRQLDDVFAIQDDISASIVETLKVKLAVGATSPKVKRAESQEAYDLYLRGMHYSQLVNEHGYLKAIELFEQAAALDPDYATAYAGISFGQTCLYMFGFLAAGEALPKAEAAAMRAVGLDDSSAEAHVAQAMVRAWFHWDWEGAGQEYRRAIQLNPGSAFAHQNIALSYLCPIGRTAESVSEIRIAQELDPLSVLINRQVGQQLYYDRQFGESIRQLRHTLEMDAEHLIARFFLALAYASNDMPDEAFLERQGLLLRRGNEQQARELEAAYREGGEPAMLRWLLQRDQTQAEKARKRRHRARIAWTSALFYARLGDTDRAFRSLSEAVHERSSQLIFAKVHPWLDSLHSDPRFGEILKKMGLD